MTRSIKPTRDRNLLAHGMWWCFHTETSTLTVRRGIARQAEPLHVDWTADDIEWLAHALDDLHAELFKLRRELERNWVEADWPSGAPL